MPLERSRYAPSHPYGSSTQDLITVPACQGDTNKHRYVVATQSQSLRNGLRIIPAVPVVHINRAVMVLEPPSEATLKAKKLVGAVKIYSGLNLTLLLD
jgi:hypothetical protein